MQRKRLLIYILCMSMATAFGAPDVYPQAQKSGEACLRIGADTLFSADPGVKRVLQAMYDRAGICAEMIPMAPARSGRLLLEGQIDGNTLRTPQFVSQSPDTLIEVPQPAFEANVVLLSLEAGVFSGDVEDLKGLRVGHYAGMAWMVARSTNSEQLRSK